MARRTVRDVTREIEALAKRRQELWHGDGGNPGEADKIGQRIGDLYEEKRALQAGTDREAIVRRARVETELERLMTG